MCVCIQGMCVCSQGMFVCSPPGVDPAAWRGSLWERSADQWGTKYWSPWETTEEHIYHTLSASRACSQGMCFCSQEMCVCSEGMCVCSQGMCVCSPPGVDPAAWHGSLWERSADQWGTKHWSPWGTKEEHIYHTLSASPACSQRMSFCSQGMCVCSRGICVCSQGMCFCSQGMCVCS